MEQEHHHQIHTINNERLTLIVIGLTCIAMVGEIIYGYITNSMALLADGWHMGTHAFALSITYSAYFLMRKFDNSPIFPNGTQNISHLAGYTSAIFLGITGIFVIIESVKRFLNPLEISFNNAIIVASVGLVVNSICLFIMEYGNHNNTADTNFKAAYLHIAADILTSVLAIFALLAGKFLHIHQFDALTGMLGGFLIIKWSYGLIVEATKCLTEYKSKEE